MCSFYKILIKIFSLKKGEKEITQISAAFGGFITSAALIRVNTALRGTTVVLSAALNIGAAFFEKKFGKLRYFSLCTV